jgi:hypothetical protein
VLQAKIDELTRETTDLVQHFRFKWVKNTVVPGQKLVVHKHTLILSGLKREANGVLTTPSVKISV